MKTIKLVIVNLLLLIFLPLITQAQIKELNHGHLKYQKENGKWYKLIEQNKQQVVESQIIIKINPRNEIQDFSFKDIGLEKFKIIKEFLPKDYYLLQIEDNSDIMVVSERLIESKYFLIVEPNLYGIPMSPGDQYYSSQWNLTRLEMEKAWLITAGSSSIRVAVADNGADYNHPDIVNNKISTNGYNFFLFNDRYNPTYFTTSNFPTAAHGTCCAGIISSTINNTIGTAGMAGGWGSEGAEIVHYVVADHANLPNVGFVALAIGRAVANENVKVISMSLDIGSDVGDVVKTATEEAKNSLIMVAAAGNYIKNVNEDKSVRKPAMYSNVISVGATTETDIRKKWDTEGDNTDEPNWGSCYDFDTYGIDVVAPGIHIPTTDIRGSKGYSSGDYHLAFNGTSAAAPHVAALAGLILSINSSLTPSQVKDIIKDNSDFLSHMNHFEYGEGRINAYKALKYTIENYGGTFNQDVTIPAGDTWNIQSGVTLKFNSGNSLIVNGTLNANGVTFTKNSSNWGGIKFNSGSSGSLQYCNINYASTGVYCNQSLPTITNCNISNNYTGIELYNIGVQTNNIGNNTIQYNQYYGIKMTYSSPRNIYGNTIRYNGQAGIYCLNYSTPYIYNNTITNNGAAGITFATFSPGRLGNYSGGGGYNLITGNYWGVSCGYESDAVLGTTSQYGYNSIHDNTYHEVRGEYDSHVMAENNWWNRVPPTYPNYYYSGDFYTQLGGTIDYSPALQSSPLGGLMAVSRRSVESNLTLSKEIGNDLLIDSELMIALNNLLEGKYDEAEKKYIQRFRKETNNTKKKYILNRIAECKYLSGKNGFVDFLQNEVRLGLSKTDELYATTLVLENMFLIEEKEYEKAINNFEILKKDFSSNEAIVKTALVNLLCLNYNQLNDVNKANMYYTELKTLYPDDELTINSKIILSEFNGSYDGKIGKETEANTNSKNELTLLDNYPNPFNPTTKIAFTLHQKDNVKLLVYDILGREVARLADGFVEAGRHEFDFDASNLPSGVYFYNIQTSKGSISKKMILLK